MYPTPRTQELTSYELYLDAETRLSPFAVLSPRQVEVLRLSGDCQLPATPWTPALRHATLVGVTGNDFDQHTPAEWFPGARLVSFAHGRGGRLCFELRSRHLASLARLAGPTLRRLVLLRCSRLASAVLADALRALPLLEYLALDLITVDELSTDFIPHLSPTLQVLKLQITNALYALPRTNEERAICESLEVLILCRADPLRHAALSFRADLLEEGERGARWKSIAKIRSFSLEIGPWHNREISEL